MQEKNHIHSLLTRSELKSYLEKNDLKAIAMLATNWGIILFSFLLAGFYPNVLTILLAMVLLAGRQLGLSILMHDCSHYALFKNRRANELIGEYFCGAPVLIKLSSYRAYHLKHHQKAGTLEDPDLDNYRAYPVTKDSMKRKIIRDLTGQTGIRNFKKVLAASLGFHLETFPASSKFKIWRSRLQLGFLNLWAAMIVNLGMFLFLYSLGIGWAYLLWILSYFTFYQLFLRIRNAAEHGAIADPFSNDPRLHTRTTLANWWERLCVAPNYVNYHVEHHLWPAVPPYQLKQVHRKLMELKAIPRESLCHGYIEVLTSLTGKKDSGN